MKTADTVMIPELTLKSHKLSEQTKSEQQKLIVVALCNPQIFQKRLKQISISSSDNKLGVLSKLNPFHIAKEINGICGEVDNIEY